MLQKVMAVPGPKSSSLLKRKSRYVARGISNTTPVFVAEAKGALIKDVDGNEYIDFYGGIGTLNAGHCPEPVVAAIKSQADKLLHSCFMVTMYENYVDLAERLAGLCPVKGENKKVMFANSGAEAVENAVKIARFYAKKPGIIAFECAFHGRTLMAMSLTSKVKPYKFGFGPFAPEVYKVPSAYCYRCYYNSTYPGCGLHCLENFTRFFAAEVAPENIAAMIIEPVQGEGGFIVPPPEFLPGLQKICEKHGIILIVDEVQTGFCRTGRMFAVEHWGVQPDLMTVAKSIASGLPLSGVIGRADVMDAPDPGHIGGTYGGNPISCAAALATIDYMQEQKLADRAAKIGETALGRLRAMQEKYPLIGDVRGLGAMVAMELVRDRKTKEPAKEEAGRIIQECYKRGLIIIGAGIFGNVVRMLMPLTITDEQLEQGFSILEEVVAEVAG
ncbi:4-aminobutyrate aminotransferase / (S)-3-amino-2-methylpropionate transaminase [Desulfofundulus australicus DSM 11792]|uniref:4-aminobutyrate aminotransferase n=1 Tax=Desulfofundulus australicus DSM 11792 TaxID=1121425 RepID=A0A1M4XGH8_9FIRM|nr:4-aminobutyrate--2-oxoglutarate transaminase [Desulfofundulus australicus]SHE92654.1 4-aminobutyrate aminotransferase / (S)-3-amino-2-methylpropionate transaminase [Desulfofundulus australicus DSM 11792]